MDIPALQPKVDISAIPLAELAGRSNIPEKEKVKEASRQFEAILLRQILTEIRKPVIGSAEEDESNETGIYNDMINNQMADCISRSGSFGLAKSLENQFIRQVLPKSEQNSTTPKP